jgi:aspartate/methionine/tyrosine aminotransferase
VIPWAAREEEGWRLDLDELRGLLTPRTRLVVVNCPNNPTGYLMKALEFRALAALCEERGVVLFSDEVYRQLEHDPALRLPAACTLSGRAVSLGVMSKAFGMGGLRVGWIASRDRKALAAAAAYKDYTTICGSAPSELLATLALRQAPRILQAGLERVLANRALLQQFLAARADRFDVQLPSAGPICFVRMRDPRADSPAYCQRILDERGVLLMASDKFQHGRRHFRVGLGRAGFAAGLAAWAEAEPGS